MLHLHTLHAMHWQCTTLLNRHCLTQELGPPINHNMLQSTGVCHCGSATRVVPHMACSGTLAGMLPSFQHTWALHVQRIWKTSSVTIVQLTGSVALPIHCLYSCHSQSLGPQGGA
jgi:hypothetical protein